MLLWVGVLIKLPGQNLQVPKLGVCVRGSDLPRTLLAPLGTVELFLWFKREERKAALPQFSTEKRKRETSLNVLEIRLTTVRSCPTMMMMKLVFVDI